MMDMVSPIILLPSLVYWEDNLKIFTIQWVYQFNVIPPNDMVLEPIDEKNV